MNRTEQNRKRKFKWVRKLKYYLLKNKIHRILPSTKLTFIGHLGILSKWVASHRNLKYTRFPNKNFDYNQRYSLYQFIIDNEILGEEIDYLEFGVAKGTSFRWWVENITHTNSSFFGFDTFTGLPEDWGFFKKGAMSNGNVPPQINDSRHQFYQGIFQKTVYDFLKSYQVGKKNNIHGC